MGLCSPHSFVLTACLLQPLIVGGEKRPGEQNSFLQPGLVSSDHCIQANKE
jgi:hypothetical protein